MLREISTFLLVFAVFGSAIADSPAASQAKKALFIGIDGTRFDAVQASRTPNLDRLLAEGIHAENCLILGDRYRKNDTVSGPGWSSILTGVWADKHGVHDNSFQGRHYDRYPHLFTLLKRQRPEMRTASIVTWRPIDQYIVSDADVRMVFEDESKDYAAFDTAAAAAAIEHLADPQLDCLFLYFGQVDETGHANGFHPSVAPYREAIQRVDGHLGEVLAALQARPSYAQEDWLIVLTSDHGGQGLRHGGGHDVPEILNSFLIVSGPSAARGRFGEQTYLVDAPVTVLMHLGAQLDEAWDLDGKPRGVARVAAGEGEFNRQP
jgi:predicted AlkP superfamily pyrophosphatase or phosphodiesterase